MAKAHWGRKHVCLECQAPFYDMRHDPIACPKCGATHRPVALLKSDGRQPRRNRLSAAAAPAVVREAPAASEEEAPEIAETDDVDDAAEEPADVEADDEEAEPVGDGREH
jgi:uncharacterized protein (TIGR02300 family)